MRRIGAACVKFWEAKEAPGPVPAAHVGPRKELLVRHRLKSPRVGTLLPSVARQVRLSAHACSRHNHEAPTHAHELCQALNSFLGSRPARGDGTRVRAAPGGLLPATGLLVLMAQRLTDLERPPRQDTVGLPALCCRPQERGPLDQATCAHAR